MRSRAVSLPRLRWRATASVPPPSRTRVEPFAQVGDQPAHAAALRDEIVRRGIDPRFRAGSCEGLRRRLDCVRRLTRIGRRRVTLSASNLSRDRAPWTPPHRIVRPARSTLRRRSRPTPARGTADRRPPVAARRLRRLARRHRAARRGLDERAVDSFIRFRRRAGLARPRPSTCRIPQEYLLGPREHRPGARRAATPTTRKQAHQGAGDARCSSSNLALQRWWLQRMIASPAPLQEKMTLFWHGHFTSELGAKGTSPEEALAQNNLFRAIRARQRSRTDAGGLDGSRDAALSRQRAQRAGASRTKTTRAN